MLLHSIATGGDLESGLWLVSMELDYISRLIISITGSVELAFIIRPLFGNHQAFLDLLLVFETSHFDLFSRIEGVG